MLGEFPEVAQIIVEGLLIILAVGSFVAALVSGLKKAGLVKDSQAGKWNAALSAVLSVVTSLLGVMGASGQVGSVQDGAVVAADLIVVAVVYMVSSKLVYALLKWIGLAYSHSAAAANARPATRILNTPDRVSTGAAG